jgi:hypothetical protein
MRHAPAHLRPAIGCLLLLTTLAGCTTYVGHKLPASGELPAGATGLPYTMTRPEYHVDITPDAEDPSKPVFTLKVTNVPDAGQRYTLALDPTLLANGKIDLTFGDGGNITDSTSTVTSQVVATIKAVAAFAVDQSGIKALQDDQSPLPAYRRTLRDTCAKDGVGTAIDTDMSVIQQAADLAKPESGNDAVLEKYFPKSAAQRDCLAVVRQSIITAGDKKILDQRTKYTAARDRVPELPAGLQPLKIRMDDWVNASDASSLKSALAYAQKLTPAQQELTAALLTGIGVVNAKIDAEKQRNVAKLLDMSPNVWKSRYVKELDQQIEADSLQLHLATLAKASPKAIADIRATIALREDQRADALGGLVLLARIRKLDEFLSEIRETAGPDGQLRIAADEHVKLREERDRLRVQMKDLAAAATTANDKGNSKVKARSNVPVRVVKASYIEALRTTPAALFSDLSDFVIVLEPIPVPSTAVAPTQIGVK